MEGFEGLHSKIMNKGSLQMLDWTRSLNLDNDTF